MTEPWTNSHAIPERLPGWLCTWPNPADRWIRPPHPYPSWMGSVAAL